jgi:hypothetical protein
MKYSQYTGAVLCIICAIAACYLPWVALGNEVWTGLHAGSVFRAPGKFHIFFCSIAFILYLIPKMLAKQANLIFVCMNMAWAIRNFLAMWRSNDNPPPTLQYGIYILILAAFGMIIMTLTAKVKVKV